MGQLVAAVAAFFICCSVVQGANAAGNLKGGGLLVLAQVGDRPGQISTGHCRCKDQCDAGRSIFSEGRTVAQCKAKCQQAFSGCKKGEMRSKQRRD